MSVLFEDLYFLYFLPKNRVFIFVIVTKFNNSFLQSKHSMSYIMLIANMNFNREITNREKDRNYRKT